MICEKKKGTNERVYQEQPSLYQETEYISHPYPLEYYSRSPMDLCKAPNNLYHVTNRISDKYLYMPKPS